MHRRHFLRLSLPLALAGRATAAPGGTGPELTFGVIADPQYADVNRAGSRHYRESLRKLPAAITELNKHPLAFVVTLGDIIDRNFKSFADIMPLYGKLKAPARFVAGNHDFSVDDADKAKVLPTLGLDPEQPYRREDHGSWSFLHLDGTELGIWRHPKNDPRTEAAFERLRAERDAGNTSAKGWNSGLGEEQMAWLQRQLEETKADGRRVILFNHWPTFPADGHNLWNAEEVVALLAQHDHVAAYMNGHNHSGNYASHDGCHYVNFKGMVETEDRSAYAIVRCFPDRLEVDGFDTEPDRKLGREG